MRKADRKKAHGAAKQLRQAIKYNRRHGLNTVLVAHRKDGPELMEVFRAKDTKESIAARVKRASVNLTMSGVRFTVQSSSLPLMEQLRITYSRFTYGPGVLYALLSEPYAIKGLANGGWSTGVLYKSFKYGTAEFREAVAVLVEEGEFVVLKNGFIWLKAVAETKLGTPLLQYTLQEIRR